MQCDERTKHETMVKHMPGWTIASESSVQYAHVIREKTSVRVGPREVGITHGGEVAKRLAEFRQH